MPADLTELRYIVLAAETGSFSRAAADLGIKQSTLSGRISALEGRLGLKLFARTTRGARPTPTGQLFVDRSRRLLKDADGLYENGRAIAEGRAGSLAVGFSTSLAAGNMRVLISDFLRQYPELRLSGVEGDRCDLSHALEAGTVDIAIVNGDLPNLCLRRRPLWSERVMAVLWDDHPAAGKQRIYWPDLREQRIILPRQDPGADLAHLARARLSESGSLPDIEMQAVSRDNIGAMVSLGHFVSLTTEATPSRVLSGAVLRELIDMNGRVTRIDYTGYWHKDNQNPVLRQLLRLISDRYPG